MDNRDHPQFGSGSRGASSDSTSFPRSSIAEWTSSGTADNVHRMPRLFRSLHITLPTSAAWVVLHSWFLVVCFAGHSARRGTMRSCVRRFLQQLEARVPIPAT